MTEPRDAGRPDGTGGDDLVVTRSEEQLLVTKPWFPYRRYRIGKRVVTETKTVTVEVRREEIVYEDLGEADPSSRAQPDALSDGPFEIVLHQEKVMVKTVAVPVERYRFSVKRVDTSIDVHATLAQEQIVVEEATGQNS